MAETDRDTPARGARREPREGESLPPAALVVGGTGMLRPVSLALAAGGCTAVVARPGRRLASLAAESSAILPVGVDWHDGPALDGALARIVAERGPFNLCVAWIHSDAPAAPLAVARRVCGDFVHVLGSAVADPARRDGARRARFERLPGLRYREVVLGFVREGGGSRWLTDAEIAAGVLAAVRGAAPWTPVGEVDPWDARPGGPLARRRGPG